MATQFLTSAERATLTSWPTTIDYADLVAHFALSIDDVRWVRTHRDATTRLVLAIGLGTLGWLGHLPSDMTAAPRDIVTRTARRVSVPSGVLASYTATSARVRQADIAEVVARAGWRVCSRGDWKRIGDWLMVRALEHDDPTVLFRLALDHLRSEQIVRPGIDRVQRAVAGARGRAEIELYLRCRPFLNEATTAALDALVKSDAEQDVAPLVWISTGATSAVPDAIKLEATKLTFLNSIVLDRALVEVIPAERRRHLAQLARRSTPAAIRRMSETRRYPMLVSWLATAHALVIDELIQQFDLALAATDHRVRHLIDRQRADLAAADVARLGLLDEILAIVLDNELVPRAVGEQLRRLGIDRLAAAVRPPEDRPPADRGQLALLAARYNHLRSFAPAVLAAVEFETSITASDTLAATQLLQELNRDGRRRLPDDAPDSFVPDRWRVYLEHARATGDETRRRHYWELATLYRLRDALRSGEISVKGSRRYANTSTYLIDPDQWPVVRDEVLALTDRPATFAVRLAALDLELEHHLGRLHRLLASDDGLIRLTADGQLKLSPLPAEPIDPAIVATRDQLTARIPRVPITDLLIETDLATRFTAALTHAAGSPPRSSEIEHRRNVYAAILAQACNLGIDRMADLVGISADTLAWTTRWYLREDTLRAANAAIVNSHHQHRLAAIWGGGTLSSSDGLRLPMRGQSLTARRLSRYFVDEGVTQYTHVSDQHTTYGTQIIVTTDRDATYTLDEILGNITELAIEEHTTDSHGQTLLTFGLYDLVGLRLSPRIARLTEQRLWRTHPANRYQQWYRAAPFLAHRANTDLIHEHWDDLLRIGGSLKQGHVSAALLVARLQAGARQHPLARALIEYGKLLRTVHTLRWYTDTDHRRRMHRQLNRGEALHDLRRFIAFAHAGQVRHRHHDDQTTQAHCHTLVVNACVHWTTTYLQRAIDAHQTTTGEPVPDEVITHTSPARYEHINPYGTYTIDIPAVLNQPPRPLRPPRYRKQSVRIWRR